jgi:hypothetical protein
MATSTKFLGAARLSNRHVPEAATTEHVGEQVAGVVEQALLDPWVPAACRCWSTDTCTHHRHASISLLVAILPPKKPNEFSCPSHQQLQFVQ